MRRDYLLTVLLAIPLVAVLALILLPQPSAKSAVSLAQATQTAHPTNTPPPLSIGPSITPVGLPIKPFIQIEKILIPDRPATEWRYLYLYPTSILPQKLGRFQTTQGAKVDFAMSTRVSVVLNDSDFAQATYVLDLYFHPTDAQALADFAQRNRPDYEILSDNPPINLNNQPQDPILAIFCFRNVYVQLSRTEAEIAYHPVKRTDIIALYRDTMKWLEDWEIYTQSTWVTYAASPTPDLQYTPPPSPDSGYPTARPWPTWTPGSTITPSGPTLQPGRVLATGFPIAPSQVLPNRLGKFLTTYYYGAYRDRHDYDIDIGLKDRPDEAYIYLSLRIRFGRSDQDAYAGYNSGRERSGFQVWDHALSGSPLLAIDMDRLQQDQIAVFAFRNAYVELQYRSPRNERNQTLKDISLTPEEIIAIFADTRQWLMTWDTYAQNMVQRIFAPPAATLTPVGSTGSASPQPTETPGPSITPFGARLNAPIRRGLRDYLSPADVLPARLGPFRTSNPFRTPLGNLVAIPMRKEDAAHIYCYLVMNFTESDDAAFRLFDQGRRYSGLQVSSDEPGQTPVIATDPLASGRVIASFRFRNTYLELQRSESYTMPGLEVLALTTEEAHALYRDIRQWLLNWQSYAETWLRAHPEPYVAATYTPTPIYRSVLELTPTLTPSGPVINPPALATTLTPNLTQGLPDKLGRFHASYPPAWISQDVIGVLLSEGNESYPHFQLWIHFTPSDNQAYHEFDTAYQGYGGGRFKLLLNEEDETPSLAVSVGPVISDIAGFTVRNVFVRFQPSEVIDWRYSDERTVASLGLTPDDILALERDVRAWLLNLNRNPQEPPSTTPRPLSATPAPTLTPSGPLFRLPGQSKGDESISPLQMLRLPMGPFGVWNSWQFVDRLGMELSFNDYPMRRKWNSPKNQYGFRLLIHMMESENAAYQRFATLRDRPGYQALPVNLSGDLPAIVNTGTIRGIIAASYVRNAYLELQILYPGNHSLETLLLTTTDIASLFVESRQWLLAWINYPANAPKPPPRPRPDYDSGMWLYGQFGKFLSSYSIDWPNDRRIPLRLEGDNFPRFWLILTPTMRSEADVYSDFEQTLRSFSSYQVAVGSLDGIPSIAVNTGPIHKTLGVTYFREFGTLVRLECAFEEGLPGLEALGLTSEDIILTLTDARWWWDSTLRFYW